MPRYAKPPYGERFTDPVTKAISTPWRLFFDFLVRQSVRTPEVQTATGPTITLVADSDGFYTVQGGTVTAIGISRNGSAYIDIGVTAGPVPVQRNDYVQIICSSDPVITWFGDIKES